MDVSRETYWRQTVFIILLCMLYNVYYKAYIHTDNDYQLHLGGYKFIFSIDNHSH